MVGDDLRSLPPAADLLLAFYSHDLDAATFDELRARCPGAVIVGCSTAGAIAGAELRDALVVAGLRFDRSQVRLAKADVSDPAETAVAAVALARQLRGDDLRHVLVLSDGLGVNGTELARTLVAELPSDVTVSGGLAADPGMVRTSVAANAPSRRGVIAAVGFYGRALRIACGSLGGWDPFGPARRITRARGNVLFELDHQPALALYRRYLGAHAEGLPATGLLFPLALRAPGGDGEVVRTIVGIDEETGSIVFAGDMPEGHQARLMKASFDRLVDGAGGAARQCAAGLGGTTGLALLVSCAGRRLVLQQRVEEELEAVRDVVGATPMVGFYSLGELCPSPGTGGAGLELRQCELHNQTMTITTFAET